MKVMFALDGIGRALYGHNRLSRSITQVSGDVNHTFDEFVIFVISQPTKSIAKNVT